MYVCTVEERARERLSGFFIPSAPVSRVCVCRVDAFRLVCFFLFLLLALRRGGGGGELGSFFFFFFSPFTYATDAVDNGRDSGCVLPPVPHLALQ
jgi:hypothetical protein